jgi:DNA polymerase I-like protein with 3'-5' exonuclease and polymerase domains
MNMNNMELMHKRICNFSGKDIDPNSDAQVEDILRNKFNIHLPQRKSLNDSLKSAASDHEIIGLILNYRTMC